MKYIYDEIKDTAFYKAAERDGRLFNNEETAIMFATMFGGSAHEVVQQTPFREVWDDEFFTKEFIVA